jgi:Transposase DDE domain group 1
LGSAFLRALALPAGVEHWALTTVREKLIKIGARIVRRGRYVVFQLAAVAVACALLPEILGRIKRLRLRPPPVPP